MKIIVLISTLACLGLQVMAMDTPNPKKATKSATSKKPSKGKVQAPVDVSAKLAADSARITLAFKGAAEDVTLSVRGVDGMEVTDFKPPEQRSFKSGDKLTLDVAFRPGEGQSHLVVSVEGSFGARRMGIVRSFGHGKPSPEQLKAAQGRALVDHEGKPVKLMPVPDK